MRKPCQLNADVCASTIALHTPEAALEVCWNGAPTHDPWTHSHAGSSSCLLLLLLLLTHRS